MIKCPYCPNVEFDIGTVKIGNNGSVDVIYCAQCEKIISVLEKTLKKPHDVNKTPGVTQVPFRP